MKETLWVSLCKIAGIWNQIYTAKTGRSVPIAANRTKTTLHYDNSLNPLSYLKKMCIYIKLLSFLHIVGNSFQR